MKPPAAATADGDGAGASGAAAKAAKPFTGKGKGATTAAADKAAAEEAAARDVNASRRSWFPHSGSVTKQSRSPLLRGNRPAAARTRTRRGFCVKTRRRLLRAVRGFTHPCTPFPPAGPLIALSARPVLLSPPQEGTLSSGATRTTTERWRRVLSPSRRSSRLIRTASSSTCNRATATTRTRPATRSSSSRSVCILVSFLCCLVVGFLAFL